MNIDYKKLIKQLKITTIVLVKIIASLVLTCLVVILPLAAYSITKVPVLLFLVLIAVYVNWVIWTKGIVKKIIMLSVLFGIFIWGLFWATEYMGIQSDYCIEDGDCKEGREINTKHGLITINKEKCIKYGWEWNDKRRECKIKTEDFSK